MTARVWIGLTSTISGGGVTDMTNARADVARAYEELK
jgi:hypothetical protein